MWLNDFLPNSARNCRILIFGYNASIVNTPSTNILYDLVSDFKEKLQTIQRVPLVCPLLPHFKKTDAYAAYNLRAVRLF